MVTDPGNNRINIYNEDGKLVRAIDSSVGGFELSPSGITLDQNNNLYIADEKNNRIINESNTSNYKTRCNEKR